MGAHEPEGASPRSYGTRRERGTGRVSSLRPSLKGRERKKEEGRGMDVQKKSFRGN